MVHAEIGMKAMNLRNLRTFVAIADAGGIARAGAHLNLSQPAASRQILALEASLGLKLFDRVGRRFRLTSEGEYLLTRSRRLLVDADSLAVEAEALKKGQTGLLRVGATPQMIECTLAPFLADYRLRHPGVEVHFVEEGGLRVADRLERGHVHLAVVPPDERFQQRPLFLLYVLAVLSEDHRLSRHRTLDIAELADEPLLLLNPSFGTRGLFDAACSIARIRPRVLLESGAPHTLLALGRTGYGIAVIPSSLLIPDGVHAMPMVQGGVAIGSWPAISWDPARFLAPFGKQFVEELVAYCRRAHRSRGFRLQAPPLPKALARQLEIGSPVRRGPGLAG
jgi:LysR family transcriptional regulator, cyn operon transcriptional activator